MYRCGNRSHICLECKPRVSFCFLFFVSVGLQAGRKWEWEAERDGSVYVDKNDPLCTLRPLENNELTVAFACEVVVDRQGDGLGLPSQTTTDELE